MTTTGQAVEQEGASSARRLRQGVISIVVLSLLTAGVVLAVPGLSDVGARLGDVGAGWVVVAIVLELMSCLGYVLSFQLVFHRTPMRFAARVAWSELAFGAVVPAGGAGGAAVGAWIFRAKGFPLSRIAERTAVLFLLTSAVNVAVLGTVGLAALTGLFAAPDAIWLSALPAAVGLGAIAGFIALARLVPRLVKWGPIARRTRLAAGLEGFARSIRETQRLLTRPTLGLLGAFGYLAFDIALMWVAFHAVGFDPPFVALVLGYQVGYLSNLIPVPGGIGVLDGGLIGALALYGIPAEFSAPAVLLYHAAWLWVPTVLGSIAFFLVRRTIDEPLVLMEPGRPAR
ncbi:MAG: hypothetical protein QOJ07_2206 [Thermoleophilaceae bacterium]|nr:hypothetical protein [Thermoleophilaceae bacterium]